MEFQNLQTRGFNTTFIWIPSHVGIKGNVRADELAKKSVQKQISIYDVPFLDVRTKVSKYIANVFKQGWTNTTNNKLREVLDTVALCAGAHTTSRHDNSILNCLMTGHSRLTHEFLLKGEPAPICQNCNVQLSIRHILQDCKYLHDIRKNYFTVNNYKDIFQVGNFIHILGFLKEAGLINKIL